MLATQAITVFQWLKYLQTTALMSTGVDLPKILEANLNFLGEGMWMMGGAHPHFHSFCEFMLRLHKRPTRMRSQPNNGDLRQILEAYRKEAHCSFTKIEGNLYFYRKKGICNFWDIGGYAICVISLGGWTPLNIFTLKSLKYIKIIPN